MPPIDVVDMAPSDWPAVRTIYQDGIAGGDATFESAADLHPDGTAKLMSRYSLTL